MLIEGLYTVEDFQKDGQEVSAKIQLNKEHDIFKGHFPGNPVMPGVCMLQIIKELTERATKKQLFLSVSSNIKFMAIINPDVNPILHLSILITEEDGRPIPVGEGVIPQVKRYCGQQRYFSLNEQILRNAINDVVDKLQKKDGNNIVMVCNWRFYQQAQTVLDALLHGRATDNYFYTVKGQKIQVGAEYNAYHFAGNTLTFMHNTALTDRYPDCEV